MQVAVAPHPALHARAFTARFAQPLGAVATPPWLSELLSLRDVAPAVREDGSDIAPALRGGASGMAPALRGGASGRAEVPMQPDDAVRAAIRDLLRHGGYKPTGRGKPASEYLLRTAEQGELPAINLAVDACNAVSLHSGLPISVVDLERVREPLRIALGAPGARYAFNAAGQEIDVEGLLCLHDQDGPCANAVKDAQRSKTSAETRGTLCIVWGSRACAARTDQTAEWYESLLQRAGAAIEPVELVDG